ncbi:hypothetical protein [Desulfobacter curvatus]|uniref:hypothetical protein n=1 Tax=Desulfobacter curvatus TaxID=2290 RepID=UPI00037CE324|nr:hypothetical protein [Desulfobacter curvatus]
MKPIITNCFCRLLLIFSLIAVILTGSAAGQPLHMKPVAVIDAQMGAAPAFWVMAPANWQVSGGLTWNSALANLVTANVAITSPDGSAGAYIHPAPLYISGQIEQQWQQGALYLGMIVIPIPNSPADFVRHVVLPRQRPGARDIKQISVIDMPEWAGTIAAGSQTPGTAIQGFGNCARFSYTENGIAWEEDFYCVILVSHSPQVPNVFWLADRNLSVRAPKGQLDALKPLATTFVNSFQLDRSWFARFNSVQRQWIAARQQGIANAGKLSRAISRSSDAFDAALTQSWRTRQQAEDRAAREFSEYIRGTENYQDPSSGNSVELPGGYDHAWANPLGEYILSNDAGFNPNQNSGNNWIEINPVR